MKDLSRFESLWTTERDDVGLVKMLFEDGHVEFAIEYLPSPMDLTIEDDEMHDLVVEKMLQAGVQIIRTETY